ncbi:MAG: YraN family protein [Lachnospiraceae bacterium]|nr:YraN family protein [Lachnospiraceae bacterium]MBR4543608.1 YraN family protein [Lachnospiraceae bacterium]
MAGQNKRQTGSAYERLAAEYLKEKGCLILKMNYRNRFGEIDLIGKDGDDLVFFEVKERKTGQSGSAAEAVTLSKQKKICAVSDTYRFLENVSYDTQIRYDVIAIDGNKINWIKNAFDYVGKGF